jgi:hypothetical protein
MGAADRADRLIGLLSYFIALARFPRPHAKRIGPGKAVTLALDTNENCAGGMQRLRILTGSVLTDLHIKIRPSHMWLDATIVK